MAPKRFRRSVPDDKIVDKAFALIRGARKPVIIAGNGTIRRRASKQLRMLCDKTGLGVISTFMAKGCVHMDAEYCLYTIGLGSKDRVSLAVDDADLVITLGFDMVEYARQVLGPKDILLSDVGAHKMWIARHYHCHEPNTCPHAATIQ